MHSATCSIWSRVITQKVPDETGAIQNALCFNLRDLQAKAPRPVHKAFKAYEPGYLHIDVKYTPFTSQPENPLG